MCSKRWSPQANERLPSSAKPRRGSRHEMDRQRGLWAGGHDGRDLKRLGAQNVRVMDVGGAMFEGGFETAFQANLWLRTADRIYLCMGQFEARSYEELFQGVRALSWEQFLPRDARFPVRAKCVRSTLMSPSDVQKIVKRAVVERLKGAYAEDWFSETGALFQIDVGIRSDMVTVCIDASGEPLSKRGYRTWNGEAPLRETLAAALVLQSGWHPWQRLYDPCCGTGTILIEAAFIALNRAPGLPAPLPWNSGHARRRRRCGNCATRQGNATSNVSSGPCALPVRTSTPKRWSLPVAISARRAWPDGSTWTSGTCAR